MISWVVLVIAVVLFVIGVCAWQGWLAASAGPFLIAAVIFAVIALLIRVFGGDRLP